MSDLVKKHKKHYDGLYVDNSIRTFSGKLVNILNTDPNSIVIEDIAHSLSFIPRFGGHLSRLYSVGQHSLSCSFLVDDEYKLEALMHDATEAYMTDIPSPIKHNLPDYKEMENNLHRVICNKFGLPFPMSKEIKKIDKKMLEMEWKLLMIGREMMPIEGYASSPEEVKNLFLKTFKLLL